VVSGGVMIPKPGGVPDMVRFVNARHLEGGYMAPVWRHSAPR
jgi:hypothetical protein